MVNRRRQPSGARTKAAKPRRTALGAEVVTAALGDMRKARELLDRLIAVDPSVERLESVRLAAQARGDDPCRRRQL